MHEQRSAGAFSKRSLRVAAETHFDLVLAAPYDVHLTVPKGIITETLRHTNQAELPRRVAESNGTALCARKMPQGAILLTLVDHEQRAPLAECYNCGPASAHVTRHDISPSNASAARAFLSAIAHHVSSRSQTFAAHPEILQLCAPPEFTEPNTHAALCDVLDVSEPCTPGVCTQPSTLHIAMDEHYRSFLYFNSKLIARLMRATGIPLHEARGTVLNLAHALLALNTNPERKPLFMHADTLGALAPCDQHRQTLANAKHDIAAGVHAPSNRLSLRTTQGVHKTPIYSPYSRGDAAPCGLHCMIAGQTTLVLGPIKCPKCQVMRYRDVEHASQAFAAALPRASALYCTLAARFCAAHAIAATHPTLARSLPCYLAAALKKHAPPGAALTDIERDTLASLAKRPSGALYSLWLSHCVVPEDSTTPEKL